MKALIFVCSIIFLGSISLSAQDTVKVIGNESEETFVIVEQMPVFPGGDEAMRNFIMNNIFYPEFERENCVQGLVVVSFIVEKDGSLSNFSLLKKVSPGIDSEAVRMLRLMPKWIPGTQSGKPVRVSINLPIRFTLSDDCSPTATDFSDNTIYEKSDPMPSFPGGPVVEKEYLEKHLKYPAIARKQKTEGVVEIGFVVEKTGRLTEIKVLKSLSPELDEEALRLVREKEYWSPGKINGKLVRVRTSTKIEFKLK